MFEEMFKNVGGKIKLIAKIICVIGIAISIIAGIYMLTLGSNYFFTGLLIAAIGSLSSWISSLFTYGFGIIVSKNETVKKTSVETNQSIIAVDVIESETDKNNG